MDDQLEGTGGEDTRAGGAVAAPGSDGETARSAPHAVTLPARLDRTAPERVDERVGDVRPGVLAPTGADAARLAAAASGPVRRLGRQAATRAATRIVEEVMRSPVREAVEQAARDAAVRLAASAADRAVSQARAAAESHVLTGTALEVTTAAVEMVEQAASHPMAAAARRLAARSPLARAATATVLDVAERTVSSPVVQAATRQIVDAALDAVADAAVDVALVAGRDIVARIVRQTAVETARELAGTARARARRAVDLAGLTPVTSAVADMAVEVADAAAEAAGRASGNDRIRSAGDLLAAVAGSAVARTARDLAAQAATRAATAAIEAVMAELLRDALREAMKAALRGLMRDVAREAVLDAVRSGWAAATRPSPEPPSRRDGEVSVADLLARAARATASLVEPGAVDASAPVTGVVRGAAETAPRPVPKMTIRALRNPSRYSAALRRRPSPARRPPAAVFVRLEPGVPGRTPADRPS
ncbi:UNVERIFIED_ORG: hypothetical protein CLV66_13412 [Actinomadura viridilutea]